ENELFHKHNGGHIQYVRITNPDNLEAIKALVLRGVSMNLYQGVNINSCTCHSCGNQWSGENGESCPECKSSNIVEFNRLCGYLGMTRKHGDYTMNDAKKQEISDRISM
ncbi:MAG: anaerobic ribonucleoside-triphosphate reductase, partial [Cetobacterium sp.]